jgi:cation:H+ antiporter
LVTDTWPLVPSVLAFIPAATVIGVVGSRLSGYADILADRTGLGEAFVGAVLLGAATSLSGIIGGNAFDTLFTCMADIAYRGGSIYHAASAREYALTVVMSSVLLLGLLYRQQRGPANIGFESVAILLCYGVGAYLLNLPTAAA